MAAKVIKLHANLERKKTEVISSRLNRNSLGGTWRHLATLAETKQVENVSKKWKL